MVVGSALLTAGADVLFKTAPIPAVVYVNGAFAGKIGDLLPSAEHTFHEGFSSLRLLCVYIISKSSMFFKMSH
jgi:hypothetical protein